MRLAAIDIGTNSVHMIVVRVRPDFSFEIVDREKEMVRLGAGGLDGKQLTPEAMAAALQALKKFARLAQSHHVDEILAVATSATREAENGGAFLRAIERRTGIRARIITGTEEARLIHLAAVYGVDTPKPAVVIDIGGGSVEITLGGKTDVEFARSFKIGVIRLTERFVDSDPISSRDERKMTEFIREQVDRYIEHIVERHRSRTARQARSLRGIVATAVDRDPCGVAIFACPRKASADCARRLSRWIRKGIHLPGLDPRADLLVAGAVPLDTLLKDTGTEESRCAIWCAKALHIISINLQAHRAGRSLSDVRRGS